MADLVFKGPEALPIFGTPLKLCIIYIFSLQLFIQMMKREIHCSNSITVANIEIKIIYQLPDIKSNLFCFVLMMPEMIASTASV